MQEVNGILQTFLTAPVQIVRLEMDVDWPWHLCGESKKKKEFPSAENERITLKTYKRLHLWSKSDEDNQAGVQAGRHRTSRCVTCPVAVAWRYDLSFIL